MNSTTPTRPLPRAVLLDLDDTILDDSRNVGRCWREACNAHRTEMGSVAPDALYETIRTTARWFWADAERHRVGRLDLAVARCEVVRRSLADVGIDSPELTEKIAAHYGTARHIGIQPIADAIETVQWLRDGGCRLALLTNGSGAAQRSKIARFGLADLFDLILIEGELGYGKPDLRIYRLALDRIGVTAGEAWMVGDNLEWDVAAPQRVGIFGIWIDALGAGLPAERDVRPNHVVRSLAELRDPAVRIRPLPRESKSD